MPVFGMAAGDDQDLLIEIERALRQDCPDGLAPAMVLTREIEHVNGRSLNAD